MKMLARQKTLYELTLCVISEWMDKICLQIEETGRYSEIKLIKTYLRDDLPLVFREDIVQHETSSKWNCLYTPGSQWTFQHQRLKWELLADSSLRTFGATEGFLNRESCNPPETYLSCVNLKQDSQFWCRILGDMSRLRELRLSIDMTDDILHVIGQTCSEKLEILEVYDFTKVTNLGLGYLEKCTKLKKIHTRTWCHHEDLALTGLASLLFKCSNLQQFIGYPQMGKLLNYVLKTRKQTHPLKLVHFEEKSLCDVNIATIEVLCPDLQCFAIKGGPETEYNSALWGKTFEDLANSKLELKVLKLLGNFSNYEKFEHFLLKRGSNLMALELCVPPQFNVERLNFLGEHCPNLLHLDLDAIALKDAAYLRGSSRDLRKDLFCEVRSVSFNAFHYLNLDFLLDILFQTQKIEDIRMDSVVYGEDKYIDQLLVRLLKLNSLNNLRKISASLSLKTTRRLVCELPNLREVMPLIPIESMDLMSLNEEVKATTISIKNSGPLRYRSYFFS